MDSKVLETFPKKFQIKKIENFEKEKVEREELEATKKKIDEDQDQEG